MTIWQVLCSIVRSNLTRARPLIFVDLTGEEKANGEVGTSRTGVPTIVIGVSIGSASCKVGSRDTVA